MAQQNVIVKLSLKDADLVTRGLQSAGAEGERALKRIEAASRTPSAGLRALGAASDELKGRLGGLSNEAGPFGVALRTLGTGGLAAAAGIGAVVIVTTKLIGLAREAGDFFAQLSDDAARAGTSASKMATLQGVFIANTSSADEANSALVRLRATIDDAMSGNEQARKAFENVGISLEWLADNGGDTVDVLMKIAQHGGLTAGQLNELTGKVGNALVPAMQEFAKVGVQSNEEFDTLTKQIGDAKDRIDLLDRQMTALSMGGAKEFLEAVGDIKQGLVDLTGWFLRTANANAVFWQHLRQAGMKDWLWGDPIKDALDARNKAAEEIKKQQEEFKAIVAGQVKTEQAVKNLPTPYGRPPIITLKPDGKPGDGRATPTEGDWTGIPRPKPRTQQDLDAFLAAQDAIEQRNQQLMNSLQRQWLQASGERIKLIEMERDRQLEALDVQELGEQRYADAVVLINRTADAEIEQAKAQEADRAKRLEEDRLRDSTDWSDGARRAFDDYAASATDAAANVEGVLGNAFSGAEDALTEFVTTGKADFTKFADAIIADITRMSIRMAVLGPLAKALEGGIGSLFGPSTTNTTQSGWVQTRAHGGVYGYGGNVVPFARGGLVERPTLFRFAQGTGLMGEAGPEAVMPLKRLPSGNLGVGVEAGGGPQVTVNVINNAGAQVKTEQKPDGRGGLQLDVVVDAVEQMVAQRLQRPGTTLNRALATAQQSGAGAVMQVLDVDQTAIFCPSSLGPLLGPEPEGLCVNSDGVVTLRVGDVGIRLTLRVQDAHAISNILTEFVARSVLLDIAQPQGRA